MTRKPSATTPSAEDISRHEEAVAAFLHRHMEDCPDEQQRWAALKKSEKLMLLYGMQAVMAFNHFELNHRQRDAEAELTMKEIMQLVRFQIWLEENRP